MPRTSTPSPTSCDLRDITPPDPSTSPAAAAVAAAAALRQLRELVGLATTRRFWELSEAILQDHLAAAAVDGHLDDITSADGFLTVCSNVWEDYRFHFLHTPDLIDSDDEHPGAVSLALAMVAHRIPSFVAANLGANYASLSPFVPVEGDPENPEDD